MITTETRRESHESIKPKKIPQKHVILSALSYMGKATARELAIYLCQTIRVIPSTERNYTAPRLSELDKEGKVIAVEKNRCSVTGKTVAVYKVKEVTN